MTMFKGQFWSRYKGKIFIGFLSFIAINSLVFIIIGDKLKCDKNETYNFDPKHLLLPKVTLRSELGHEFKWFSTKVTGL